MPACLQKGVVVFKITFVVFACGSVKYIARAVVVVDGICKKGNAVCSVYIFSSSGSALRLKSVF